jgi:hypothetical protein
MIDFKTQFIKDMAVFHNPGEFATQTQIKYQGKHYNIPIVIDHEAAQERQKSSSDHADGINRLEALAYIALVDLGFVPQKGSNIELDIAGEWVLYEILKSDYEDGEIILELGAFVE